MDFYEFFTNTFVQIIVAIILIIVIYIISLLILRSRSIVLNNKSNGAVKAYENTKIIQGYGPISLFSGLNYNTYNDLATNFLKIGRSVNTMGGAQFTYQFWIKVTDPNDDYFKNLIVLLKGDNRKYNVGLYDPQTNQLVATNPQEGNKADHVISCPLIKFVDSYRHIRLQLNTNKNPLINIDINMNNKPSIGRTNILSLLPLNWYLFTFIFQDNISNVTSAENGINFQFWINDILYQENGAGDIASLRNNTLKQNDGNLFLFPQMSQNNGGGFMNIGNLSYYNYALDHTAIRNTYSYGPPNKLAVVNTNAIKPVFMSEYNKMDIYNM